MLRGLPCTRYTILLVLLVLVLIVQVLYASPLLSQPPCGLGCCSRTGQHLYHADHLRARMGRGRGRGAPSARLVGTLVAGSK